MLDTGYCQEFCVSPSFDPVFIARLMQAGFLVMSSRVSSDSESCIVLPKLHLTRSALFFNNLHIKKSIRRHVPKYEIHFNVAFNRILNRCLEIHGDDWLTPPLVAAIRDIRRNQYYGVYPVSFALYRNGILAAGEFGIQVGRVYTSYSGYYEESNAGTVQLILTTRYLQENGFAFYDLGMPLDYKTDLGAVDINPREFVQHFRSGSAKNQQVFPITAS